MLKEHGSVVRYRHDLPGVNSRLDAIQAAILQIEVTGHYRDTIRQQLEQGD